MSLSLWEYFWTEADWVPPPVAAQARATRYIYRHRLNYVIRVAILWFLWLVGFVRSQMVSFAASVREILRVRERRV